jgi:hypothetical protein
LRKLDTQGTAEYGECLSPTSYAASQMLAAQLLEIGAAGIVYPSVRRRGGTCVGCFRPVLVGHVRKGNVYAVVFENWRTAARIYRA